MSEVLQATITIVDSASPTLTRINTHARELVQNFQALNKLVGGAGKLDRGTMKMQATLQRVALKTKNLEQNFRAANARVKELTTNLRNANNRIASMEQRVRIFNGQITTLTIRVAEMERDIRQMQQGVNGAAQSQANFTREAKGSANQMNRLVGMVRNLAAAYFGLQGLKKVIGITDEYTNMSARLNLVNDGLRTQSQLQREIYKSAIRSRGAYKDMAAVISRMGILAGDAFQNNNELIAFTETLQKVFKISGASTMESSSAMYQLTQAMASGRLQGDEFRSIRENAPMLANAIETYMKSTGAKGTLKDWSSQGLLTADVIKRSLFTAADEINEKFKSMPMTFAGAWSQMANTAWMIFGPTLTQINQSLGEIFTMDTVKSAAEVFHSISLGAGQMAFQIKNFIQDAGPGLANIAMGFYQVGRAVFSSNGLIATLFNTMTKLSKNRGVQQFFRVLSSGVTLGVRSISVLIQSVGGLTQSFSGALPVIGGVIVGFTAFKTLNSAFLPIARAVGTAIFVMKNNINLLTAGLGRATAAQLGLNAALNANPYIFVASAIMTVVAAIGSLIAGIAALNKAANMTTNLANIGGYSEEAWKIHEREGVSLATAQTLADDRENARKYMNGIVENFNKKVNDNLSISKSIKEDEKGYGALSLAITTPFERTRFEENKREAVLAGKDIYFGIQRINEQAAETYNRERTLKNTLMDLDELKNGLDKELQFDLNSTPLDAIAKDTGKIADSVEISEDYFELMRDLAEREAINKFTTVPIYLDARSTNNVSSEIDLDGMVTYLSGQLWEGLHTAAEGAHY